MTLSAMPVDASTSPPSQPVPRRAQRRLANRSVRSLALVVAAVVAGDQATKTWAVASLPAGHRVHLPLGVDLVHARNTGVAFSRGSGMVGIVIPILVVIGLVAWTARSEFRQPGGAAAWAPWGFGLILGGALGNVIDRFVRGAGWGKGAVIDMVDVGFWPVFNFADAALCVGVAITVWGMVRTDRARALAGVQPPNAASAEKVEP